MTVYKMQFVIALLCVSFYISHSQSVDDTFNLNWLSESENDNVNSSIAENDNFNLDVFNIWNDLNKTTTEENVDLNPSSSDDEVYESTSVDNRSWNQSDPVNHNNETVIRSGDELDKVDIEDFRRACPKINGQLSYCVYYYQCNYDSRQHSESKERDKICNHYLYVCCPQEKINIQPKVNKDEIPETDVSDEKNYEGLKP